MHSANTRAPSVSFAGSCGQFSGDAKVNQQLGYSYTVNACDNGDPGTGKDTFSITVTGPMFFYSNSGTLTSGDIQIHSE